MIPASLYLDVIRSERQLDLERWQRASEAKSAGRATSRVGRLTWLRANLDPRRWFERPAPAIVMSDEHAALSAACC